MVPLAIVLGERQGIGALLASLAVHEGAHLAAAKALRVRVEALDLMPFGGALRMESPYRLGRWQLMGVSLAGPAGNLIALCLAAALAWWGVLPRDFALELVRYGAMLAAFNLLPVLPLDGGRALFALLSPRVGRRKVLNVLVALGYLLAAALAAAAVVGFVRGGKVNLALLLAAVFLVAAGGSERREAGRGAAEALAERLSRGVRPGGAPRRMRVLAVDENTEALAVLRALGPREEALLAVYGVDGFREMLDSAAVERALLAPRDGPLTMRDLLKT